MDDSIGAWYVKLCEEDSEKIKALTAVVVECSNKLSVIVEELTKIKFVRDNDSG